MNNALSALAQRRLEKRRQHYRLPPISGTPPVMREPRRINQERTGLCANQKDFAKRLHVSCYFDWVLKTWNNANPENKFVDFEDSLDVDRRNQEHKKIIGHILRQKLPGSYRKHTLSQASIADYSAVKSAIDEICKLEELQPYTTQTYGCWAIRKLIDQHMDVVSRLCRKRQQTSQVTEIQDSLENDVESHAVKTSPLQEMGSLDAQSYSRAIIL